jgi:hypothetical protein
MMSGVIGARQRAENTLMSADTSPLERQVSRARRRLFLQTLLDALAWSWAVALLLSAAWFIAEPYLVKETAAWLRWAVLGGALGAGALAALVAAWLLSPSRLNAALALDARFNLKERVTTSLGLNEREADSAAGRALVADVNYRLAPLRLSERFPVRLPWSAAAVPVIALLLVLLSVFYRPGVGGARASGGDQPLTDDPALKQAIDQKKKDLLKAPEDRPADRRPRDPDLKKLDEDIGELAHQPTDTKDQANKFIKDAAKAEEALRDAERQMSARQDAVKERLNQEDRLNPERLNKKSKNGPAKNLQDALKDGDFQRASDALQNLSKMLDPEQQKRIKDKLAKLEHKLKVDGLTPEERQRLQEEFKKLNDELLTDEQKKGIQEALNELEQALDKLAEPEQQEKKLEEQLDKQRKDAEAKAKDLEEERKNAEEKVKEAQKKFDEKSKDPVEQNKLREQLKDLEKKAREVDQQDADPKKKAEEQEKIDEQKKELQKKADDLAKDPAEQKKADEELKKAEKEAEEKRKNEKSERQKSEREQEQTRRELDEMKKNNERINQQTKDDLKDLAKQLGECDKCMKEGKEGAASKKLQEAREKMRQMAGDDDRQRLLDQLRKIQLAREAVCQAMNAKDGQGNGDADNAGGRGVASGRRPLGKDEETQHFDTTAPAETTKGSLRITDFLNGPGGERGARGPAQMTDEMRIRAAQEGASALTRQRVERPSDTDRVRGYFDNMRGPEKPGPKK